MDPVTSYFFRRPSAVVPNASCNDSVWAATNQHTRTFKGWSLYNDTHLRRKRPVVERANNERPVRDGALANSLRHIDVFSCGKCRIRQHSDDTLGTGTKCPVIQCDGSAEGDIEKHVERT